MFIARAHFKRARKMKKTKYQWNEMRERRNEKRKIKTTRNQNIEKEIKPLQLHL